jgi:hypothetical protein
VNADNIIFEKMHVKKSSNENTPDRPVGAIIFGALAVVHGGRNETLLTYLPAVFDYRTA